MRRGMGQNGDLLLKVKVEDHKVFKREVENVVSEAEIPFTKAVFGGTAGGNAAGVGRTAARRCLPKCPNK